MKPKLGFILSLVLLFGAMVLALMNIFSGLQLSNDHSASANGHLIRAISLLVLGILGSCLAIFYSQKWVDFIRREKILKRENIPVQKSKVQSYAHQTALALILLCVLSLISGTISHAGRFPWLHALLGFSLCGGFLVSLLLWAQSFFEIQSISKDESSAAA